MRSLYRRTHPPVPLHKKGNHHPGLQILSGPVPVPKLSVEASLNTLSRNFSASHTSSGSFLVREVTFHILRCLTFVWCSTGLNSGASAVLIVSDPFRFHLKETWYSISFHRSADDCQIDAPNQELDGTEFLEF